MAAKTDSSLTFCAKASPGQWSYVLGQYSTVLSARAQETRSKPGELIKLDKWYQEQLPKIIQSRGKDRLLVHEELVQVTKWKLWRGKNRAHLLDLVRINTENAVKTVTKKAFRKIPNNINGAITALTTLKGIGPATASAVLAAGAPECCPFMADECMVSTPGVEATDYTIAEYVVFAEAIKNICERLKEKDPESKWTPHKIELALWTHYWIKQMKLPLLDDMPAEENGENLVKKEQVKEEKEENEVDETIAKSNTIIQDEDSISSDDKKLITSTNGNGNGNSNSSSNNNNGNNNNNKVLDDDSNISVPASNASEVEDEQTNDGEVVSSPEIKKAKDESFRMPEGNGSSVGACTEDSKDYADLCPSSEDNSRHNLNSNEEFSNLSYSNLSSDDLNSNSNAGDTVPTSTSVSSVPIVEELAVGGEIDGPALKKARID
ncbi:protein amun [Brevipalpus obovatus]|uniref:protein amun n=1 Tax=Brevipalpus obovatus TaxID=246614 RepID=UPI003D9F3D74